MLRMSGAVVALVEELGAGAASQFRLELCCDHFEDPSPLLGRIRTETRAAIAHCTWCWMSGRARPSLVRSWPGASKWRTKDDPELPEDGPLPIVDRKSLSWAQLGELLKPYIAGRSSFGSCGDRPHPISLAVPSRWGTPRVSVVASARPRAIPKSVAGPSRSPSVQGRLKLGTWWVSGPKEHRFGLSKYAIHST